MRQLMQHTPSAFQSSVVPRWWSCQTCIVFSDILNSYKLLWVWGTSHTQTRDPAAGPLQLQLNMAGSEGWSQCVSLRPHGKKPILAIPVSSGERDCWDFDIRHYLLKEKNYAVGKGIRLEFSSGKYWAETLIFKFSGSTKQLRGSLSKGGTSLGGYPPFSSILSCQLDTALS